MGKRTRILLLGSTVIICLGLAVQTTTGAVRALSPIKDNTLYESPTGSLSNGAGQHLFAGRTGFLSGGLIRRGLMTFDIAGNLPAGATVTSVTLTLNMSRTNVASQVVSLHRTLADWGEGTSDAAGQEGGGAPSSPGDATWIHTSFSTTFWLNSGGDFVAAPSASLAVAGIGFYNWGSSAQMVADVQGWLNNPASNFGWVIVGNETTFPTSKRFDSRQNLFPANRPLLAVEFTIPGVPAGRVPDGDLVPGIPLSVEHAALGDIRLSWDPSCLVGDSDFEIYEGALGSFAGHTPRFCSTGGATNWTFTPATGSTFYLVVPRNATREGSYGTRSGGVERPQGGVFACEDQDIGACP